MTSASHSPTHPTPGLPSSSARRPLQDPHIVPRPRRRHPAIKTLRAGKGADVHYRPTRHRRPDPVLCGSLGDRAPLTASAVSGPAPPHPPSQATPACTQGQRPLTSAATGGAPLKWTQIPPLPASSSERLRCPDPPHAHRTTPLAPKREIGVTVAVFCPSTSQLGEPPARPRRSAWSLGSLAGAGCAGL